MDMKATWISVAVVVALLGVACGKGLPDEPGAPERIAMIRENVLKLADEEMARFQAMEEKYKNDCKEFLCLAHPIDPTIGVYSKVYRQWESASVVDIRLSNSLERPYEIPVEYTYTVMATPYHSNSEPDAAERCEEETEFEPLRQETHTIAYFAAMDCELTDDRGEWPGRQNWYSPSNLKMRNIEWNAAPATAPQMPEVSAQPPQ